MNRAKALLFRFREHLFVLAGGLALLVAHAAYRIQGFGERDEARFGRDVIVWHLRGAAALDDFGYRLRASSLFMRGLKLALDLGYSIRNLPELMSWYTVVMSSVCAMALYYLFRKLTSRMVAAAIVIIYSLTPSFWLLSLYGMPTVPAIAYLVCAALAFASALEKPLPSRAGLAWLGLALVLSWLSFTHKVDVALSASVLLIVPLLARLRSPLRWRSLFVVFGSGAMVVGGATALTLLFTRALSAHPGTPTRDASSAEFFQKFQAQYPFSIDHLLSPTNNMPITHCVGTVWFAVTLLAALHGLLVRPEARARTLALLAWALPSVLFWGLQTGNNARHNLAAGAAMIALAVRFIFDSCQRPARAFIVCGLTTLIGLLDSTSRGDFAPRANFIKATKDLQEVANQNHLAVRRFMHVPRARKALIDSDQHMPYAEFEAFAAAREPTLTYDPQTVHDGRGNIVQLTDIASKAPRKTALDQAAKLRQGGFFVCSIELGFCDGT